MPNRERNSLSCRRLFLEKLEDRTLLSDVPLGSLLFRGNFQLNANGDNEATSTSSAPTLLGYAPTGSESFKPLLNIVGDVIVPAVGHDQSQFTFQGELDAAVLSNGSALYIGPASQVNTVVVSALTQTGVDFSMAPLKGGVQSQTVAQVPFTFNQLLLENPGGGSTSDARIDLQGNFQFDSLNLKGLSVGVSGSNYVYVDNNSKTLSGINASVSASFTTSGVTVKGNLNVSYTSAGDVFKFWGNVTYSTSDGGMQQVTATLGLPVSSPGQNPGLIVAGGSLSQFILSFNGNFEIFGLTIKPDNLTFEYAQNQFEMFGDLTVEVSGTTITAHMGDANLPGLTVNDSGIQEVNMGLSGNFTLFGLGIQIPDNNPLTLQYQAAQSEYLISGQIIVPDLFKATVTLGTASQPGLQIVSGSFQVNAFSLGLSDIDLGGFTIKQFFVSYTQTSTAATYVVTLDLEFPEKWEVAGTIIMVNNKINQISISWQADSNSARIPIGETGMFLTEMDATVRNIDQPSDLVVSGHMAAEFGDEVTIFGQTVTLFRVEGSFSVDSDQLMLSATVWLGAKTSNGSTTGILGTGNGQLLLDWYDKQYELTLHSSMLDGVFTYDATIQINGSFQIWVSASASVNVPHGVPLIGGDHLGTIDFRLAYDPHNISKSYVAAWTRINFFFFKVTAGIEYTFDKNEVKFIGGSAANDLSKDPFGTQTYAYESPEFDTSPGATGATLSVNYPVNSGTQSFSVILPDGTEVLQSQFAAHNITVESQTSSSYSVSIAGSSTDPTVLLPAGSYMLKQTSSYLFPDPIVNLLAINNDGTGHTRLTLDAQAKGLQVGNSVKVAGSSVSDYNVLHVVQAVSADGKSITTDQVYTQDAEGGTVKGWQVPMFSATFDTFQPTVALSGSIPQNLTTPLLSVPLSGRVDSAFTGSTTVDFYLDRDNGGYDGLLLERNVPITIDASGNFTGTAVADVSNLLRGAYFVYAVVNDGTNTPVYSQYSNGFVPQQFVQGTITNQNNEAQSGLTVFADLNRNGVQELNEPVSTATNSSGQYHIAKSLAPLPPLSIFTDLSQQNPPAYLYFPSTNHNIEVGDQILITGSSIASYNTTFKVVNIFAGQVYVQSDQPWAGNATNLQAYLLYQANPLPPISSIGASSSSSPKYVLATFSSPHQLQVGDRFVAAGSSVAEYNGLHAVTAVVSPTQVVTDIAYTANAANLTATRPVLSIPTNTPFDVMVTPDSLPDGLQFGPDGGKASNVVYTGTNTLAFDFGTDSSPVAQGFTRVSQQNHAYSSAQGYGWTNGTITFEDRGIGNALTRDFNFTPDGTFVANLPNGTYDVTLTLGDTGNFQHDDVGVFLQGVQKDTVTTPAGVVVTNTYPSIVVSNGQLSLRIASLGGSDPNAVIESMQVVPSVNFTILENSSIRGVVFNDLYHDGQRTGTPLGFDFGTSSSPLAAGFTRATSTTTYNATQGFGWTSGTIKAVDQSGKGTALIEDSNSTPEGTFVVDRPNASYNVTLWLGDTGPTVHDDVGVFLQGAQVDTVTTAAGEVVTRTYTNIVVNTGQLALTLRDLGGSDPNCVIEAIQITRVSDPGLPGWTVQLLNSSGTVVAVTQSGADGSYDFRQPANGTYTVALVPLDGAAASYTFEKVSGTTVSDTSGSPNVHDGTLTNGATVGTAASFGIGDHPQAAANNQILKLTGQQFVGALPSSDLQPGHGGLSVTGWVRIDSSSQPTIALTAPALFSTGAAPFSVTEADFNGDGKPDLATANENANTISVFLNTTAPGDTMTSFSAATTLMTGSFPRILASGDFNGDGKPDLVVPNAGGTTVSVYLNTTVAGAAIASFTDQTTFTVGSGPLAVAVADINQDGKLDIVAADELDNAVAILLNTTPAGATTPSFAGPVSFGAGTDPNYVAVGDFNADGKPDLAVTNLSGGAVALLLNTTAAGSQTVGFAAQSPLTSVYGVALAVGDFNKDGRPDLAAAAEGFGSVAVYLNTTPGGAGSLTFGSKSQFATASSEPISVAAADLNGDGKVDLALANLDGNSVSVLLNTTAAGASTPSFTAQTAFPTGSNAASVGVADFNSDGKPDLVVSVEVTNTVAVFINVTAPPSSNEVIAGSTAGTADGGWSFLINHEFNFTPPVTLAAGTNPRAVAEADLNGDGKLDLAVANQGASTISVFLNTTAYVTGPATFAREAIFATGSLPTSVAIGDFNGDGKPDLAVLNQSSNSVSVLLNTTPAGGTVPTFAPQASLVTGTTPFALAVADFNKDGKPDLIIAYISSNTVSVLLNSTPTGAAAPSFVSQPVLAVGSTPASIAIGDFNGDGRPDFVVANEVINSVAVFLNTTPTGAASTSFAAPGSFAVGMLATSVTVADFNSDGKPDIATANNEGNTVSVLLNATATGAAAPSFTTQHAFGVGSQPAVVAAGDFNADGRPDLVAINNGGGNLTVLLNSTSAGATTPSFTTGTTLTAGTAPLGLAAGDLNGDGRSDLAVANDLSNNVSVFLGTAARLEVSLAENPASGSGVFLVEGMAALNENTWYHVAFSYNPAADDNGDGTGVGTVKIYVNGILATTATGLGTLPVAPDISSTSVTSFNVGDQGGDTPMQPLTGYLDDLSVWSTPLTGLQIQALYNGSSTPSYTQTTPAAPGTYAVSISSSSDVKENNDFGAEEFDAIGGTLRGKKLMANGLYEATGDPLANWTVTLTDPAGHVVASTLSAADGRYLFTHIPSGSYQLEQAVQSGWRQTAPYATTLQFASPVLTQIPLDVTFTAAVADFDQDGHDDLAIGVSPTNSSTDYIYVYWGQANGGFSASSYNSFASPSGGPFILVAADLYGNGLKDLVVFSELGKVDQYQNIAGNSRSTRFKASNVANWNLPSGIALFNAVAGDFDGDGRQDVVASFNGSYPEAPAGYLLLPGSFGPAGVTNLTTGDDVLGAVQAGYINDDSFLDFAINARGTSPSTAPVYLEYGSGRGTFSQVILPTDAVFGTQGAPATIGLADVNGDGRLDVVFPSLFGGENAAEGLLQNDIGQFPAPGTGSVFGYTGASVDSLIQIVKDYDGDLQPDFLLLPSNFVSPQPPLQQLHLITNPGNGPNWFTGVPSIIGTSLELGYLIPADVNNDGRLDIVALGFASIPNQLPTNYIAVYLNQTVASNQTISVALGNGNDASGNDFTNNQVAQVFGAVFDDVNGNGKRDPGELPRAGISVFLDTNANGIFDDGEPSTQTADDGSYAFLDPPDGTYAVRLGVDPGRVLTAPAGGFHPVSLANGAPFDSRALDFATASAIVEPIADVTITEGTPTQFLIRPTATAAGHLLRFSLAPGAPAAAQVDPQTGLFSWNPTGAEGPGAYAIELHVTDASAGGRVEIHTFVVMVQPSPAYDFVRALYHDVLARNAEPGGLVLWAGMVQTGTSRLDVATGIWNSPEHRGLQVDGYYSTFLHRAADAAGKTAWVNRLLAGAGEAAVELGFLTSAEYNRDHATDPAYINALYHDVLGRAADPGGLAFYEQALAQGLAREQLAANFLSSTEADEELIDSYYKNYLGRTEASFEQAYWLARLQSGQRTIASVAEDFLASDEYFALARMPV